jgi:hypothetical protein
MNSPDEVDDFGAVSHQIQSAPYNDIIGHLALIHPASYFKPDCIDDHDVETLVAHTFPSFVSDPWDAWRIFLGVKSGLPQKFFCHRTPKFCTRD